MAGVAVDGLIPVVDQVSHSSYPRGAGRLWGMSDKHVDASDTGMCSPKAAQIHQAVGMHCQRPSDGPGGLGVAQGRRVPANLRPDRLLVSVPER